MQIFLNAETFETIGGWTIDTQSYETYGFCYLLAHGIGQPVADAVTHFVLPASGKFHVYVHTRNWTAVWKRGTPAGRFHVKIDDCFCSPELGTEKEAWHWQNAGIIDLCKGNHRIALHDLTGFDGRCDAVYMTDDDALLPPDDFEQLKNFRRACLHTTIEDDPEEYDLLVCGGGFAGVCAGITAKELNMRFKVIQDRPVLGGCGSSEVRVWVGGQVRVGPYPNLGNPAAAISPLQGRSGMKKEKRFFEDERKQNLFEEGKNLLLNEMVVDVEMDSVHPGRIAAVITRTIRTGKETRRKAFSFVDCTGDALLARKSGCRTMYGSEGRNEYQESLGRPETSRLVMGHSTLWETKCCEHPVSFPDIDWGIEFNDRNALARLNCCWDWETGQYRDQVKEIEYIRDYGLMTCIANWSFLKNHSSRKHEWENYDLEWISAIGGKRESYRVVGDHVLTQNEIIDNITYPDGTACITWSIDIHMPDPENQETFGEPFQSCAYHQGLRQPYPVPYRCLYAADVSNLFLGGRCVSATHVAFSSIRVMRTLGMLAEVIGMAAWICRKYQCSARAVWQEHSDELIALMKDGVLSLPCSWLTKYSESYHFMRPVNSVDNTDENCWVRMDENSNPQQPVHPSIAASIRKLEFIQHDGKLFKE